MKEIFCTSDSLVWPPICPCCLKFATSKEKVTDWQPAGSHNVRMTWTFPYCEGCKQHALWAGSSGIMLVFVWTILALLGGGFVASAIDRHLFRLPHWLIGIWVWICLLAGLVLSIRAKMKAMRSLSDQCKSKRLAVKYTYLHYYPRLHVFRFANDECASVFLQSQPQGVASMDRGSLQPRRLEK
jgi:hypothetical protein